MVGIDLNPPLDRTVSQPLADPGAACLVFDDDEREALSDCSSSMWKQATKPGTDLIVSRRHGTLASSASAG